MVRKAALILALLAGAADAKPVSTLATDIAKAKATMLSSADKTHSSMYLANAADFDKFGITASQGRALSLWITMGYSLGVCHDRGGEGLQAAWLSATDSFSPPPFLRDIGIDAVRKGKEDDDVIRDLTNAQAARFCRGEIGATRQLLAERFGVR